MAKKKANKKKLKKFLDEAEKRELDEKEESFPEPTIEQIRKGNKQIELFLKKRKAIRKILTGIYAGQMARPDRPEWGVLIKYWTPPFHYNMSWLMYVVGQILKLDLGLYLTSGVCSFYPYGQEFKTSVSHAHGNTDQEALWKTVVCFAEEFNSGRFAKRMKKLKKKK